MSSAYHIFQDMHIASTSRLPNSLFFDMLGIFRGHDFWRVSGHIFRMFLELCLDAPEAVCAASFEQLLRTVSKGNIPIESQNKNVYNPIIPVNKLFFYWAVCIG